LKRTGVVVAALALLVSCNVERADQGPAIAVADKFYAALKAGDVKDALSQFSLAFKTSVDTWPQLLDGLEEKTGAVSSTELLRATLAANDGSPCYLLTYAVKRGSVATDEKLFVCRNQGSSSWAIVGHEIIRSDTKKTIVGGLIPAEASSHLP
jgi:hypothetical protein